MAVPLGRSFATRPGVRRMPTPIMLPTMTASPNPSPTSRRSRPMGERETGLAPLMDACIAPHASPAGGWEANSPSRLPCLGMEHRRHLLYRSKSTAAVIFLILGETYQSFLQLT